ncbi:Serpin domain,Serpin, conserved site [Cinara cedri]|uniref:Serpin domain,Serpin, conserved site n=1 Tax=Cinara cedri TaxID=506608 RepID=A0A5E4NLI3_9HEMI|nr:Serpin domain,Serpin, conserved site [Cinara cedri]
MNGYLSLSIIFCLFLTALAAKPLTKRNSTENVRLPPTVSNNNIPDIDVFNWKLCKALNDIEENNAVISTVSVKLVLLVLYEGALGNTAKQIENVVDFPAGSKSIIRDRYLQKLQSLQSHKHNYELDIGTKLFMDKQLVPENEFLKTINQWYNASYEEVDFNKPIDAVNVINQWAENITHGRIQHLITEAETKENTVLLLLNAVYFKGYWANPFNANLTKKGSFNLNSKTVVEVPLMTIFDSFQLSTIESLNARIISLPYEGNKFVMYIILPDSKDGLNDLINKIKPSLLGESIKNMKTLSTRVVLPKFSFEYTSILGPILQKLGMTDMFGTKANLTNIGKGPYGSLKVSNVLQKAGIEVNEQGSIAHAVTEVDLDHRFGTSVEAVFEVNRPFLFVIEDISMHTIIFVGKVTNPLSRGSTVVSIPLINTSNSTTIKPVVENNDVRINLVQDTFPSSFSYFDYDLFQELSAVHLDTNFVVSPASVKSILSLLLEGAREETLKQLKRLLRLPNDQSELHNLLRSNQLSMKSNIVELVVVNNVFVKNKNSLSINFKDIAIDLYSAKISEIDFANIDASVKMINEQVSSDTKGLINNIISKDDFDGNTELLLANVLYFNGDWLVEFNISNTKNACFYSKPNTCTEVNMMNLRDKIKYGYISDMNSHAIELPYKDTNMSMIVLLPDEQIPFTHFLKDLKHNSLPTIINSLQPRNVDLQLPRFTMSYSTKLSTVLKKMGLTTIFDENANLSSIFNPIKKVHVKDVTHKVIIEVDEKGSKAGAVTVLNVVTLSSFSTPQSPTVPVNINRPFVFYIINRLTKTALFSGQVQNLNPSTEQNNLMNPLQETVFRIPFVQTNTISSPSIALKQTQEYQQPVPTDSKSVVYPINTIQNN